MNDADRFAAQDTAHDMCESYCGLTILGVDCPKPIMKGLLLTVYYPGGSGGDHSQHVVAIGEGIAEVFAPSDKTPAVKLVRRSFGSREYMHLEPVEPCPKGHIGYMASGKYAHTSDGRWDRITQYPLPIHDRYETQAEYNALSR